VSQKWRDVNTSEKSPPEGALSRYPSPTAGKRLYRAGFISEPGPPAIGECTLLKKKQFPQPELDTLKKKAGEGFKKTKKRGGEG